MWKIQKYRINSGYSQERLAEAVDLSTSYISEIENGKKRPSMKTLEKIAAAYGFAFFRLSNNREAEEQISRILAQPGPVIIEVMTDPMENLQPKAASKRLPDGSLYSAPLEDMAPFLDREEFMQNMLIEPYDEVQQ